MEAKGMRWAHWRDSIKSMKKESRMSDKSIEQQSWPSVIKWGSFVYLSWIAKVNQNVDTVDSGCVKENTMSKEEKVSEV